MKSEIMQYFLFGKFIRVLKKMIFLLKAEQINSTKDRIDGRQCKL